jgi:PAS domain S-box-containing protein
MSAAQMSNGHEENSILIVNDVPEQLLLMHGLLRNAGYSVMTAEDGVQALDIARQSRPDLVISDVSMPRMNGLEFCRVLRSDTELRATPVLLISALQKDTETVVAGLTAGADDYLEVPFDSTRLVAKVSRLLERSRLEASYRDLVENATDMIFTQDLTGRLTNVNEAVTRFLGRDSSQLVGQSFASTFGVIPEANGSIAGQDGFPVEFRHQFVTRSAAGEDRWLDLIISPIKDKLDETVGYRGLARDVTDRKKFEIALKDSEERYRLLFESTPQPIWVYNEETLRFLAVNEAATRIYGFSKEEFLTMTVNDIRPKEDIPALLIKNGQGDLVLSSPWRHETRDNKTIYVELSSHPIVFDGKNSRLVIVNDVTERKLLDEKQQRLHVSLQQSAMEWRQTFNAIDFPVLIVDLEGVVKRANEAAEKTLGVGAELVIGHKFADISDNQPWRKASELLQSIKSTTDSPMSAEVKDEGTSKTWALTVYLIHEFGSVSERAILIAQDISKRAELEASLRQSEMMSLLGSLVAGVAHEVRNPLFGISSILDAFETRFSDRTEYKRYTDVLRDEIGRLTVLMEELLEYGKPFRGELFVVSLEEIIARCIRACLPTAEVANVRIESDFSALLPQVRIDRRRLSKVFVNLIENAIQHSPTAGVVKIEARPVSDGKQEWIQCSVKDSGSGIAAEDLPRIFEPFFSKRRGGTGLGLAIAQRIMQEHGGKLVATNNPEGGACMIASFPLATEEDS